MARGYYKRKSDCTPEEWADRQAKRRQDRRKERSGITPLLFSTLVSVQKGACAVCGAPLTPACHADHCHDTGAPRGVLCRSCNLAEGHIKKTGLSPAEFGLRLQKYLEAPPAGVALDAIALAG